MVIHHMVQKFSLRGAVARPLHHSWLWAYGCR